MEGSEISAHPRSPLRSSLYQFKIFVHIHDYDCQGLHYTTEMIGKVDAVGMNAIRSSSLFVLSPFSWTVNVEIQSCSKIL